MPPDSTTPPSPGAGALGGSRRVVRMGKYEVVQHIATGGMGAVYRARDTEMDREVALKVLPAEFAAQPRMLERFRREARSAGKLAHDNVVSVYEFDEANGHYFIAMEFVDGIDLHEYVKSKGTLEPEEARQIALQGARALAHAAEHRLVHRDVKPSNFLLLRKAGRVHVKLTDFGLAREVAADEFRVTRAGTTVGTLDYMSPEQARDSSAADIRSDLYSLGCTWYHLLSGHAPFPEGGLGERLIKIMTRPAPDIRELNPRVSDETWRILRRLLAKDPADRYPSPAALIDDLIALEGDAVARRPARPNRKPRKTVRPARHDEDTDQERPLTKADANRRPWAIYGGVGGAALALTLGVVLFLARGRPAPVEDEPPAQPGGPGDRVLVTPAVKRPEVQPPDDKERPPPKPRWAALYKPAVPIDPAALRREVAAPWADAAAPAADPFVARVSRAGPYRSLAAAIAAAPPGKPVVLEVHDNGPLFELPVAVDGRDLTVRAAAGYQPLILWDIPATLLERRRARKDDRPLVFAAVRKGRLVLEGLEVAWRWPASLSERATVLSVDDGELVARACTFSGAGKPPDGVTLIRCQGGREKARCRLERCHARGGGLTALDVNAPGADVLLDRCLVAGGLPPLLRVVATERQPTRLAVVRSTLLCGQTLVELKPAAAAETAPDFSCLCWDSLLGRGGAGTGGALLALVGDTETRRMNWRAVNTLYAGWPALLAGRKGGARDLAEWQRLWARTEGDAVARGAWPERQFTEPAEQPAAVYQPAGPVGFASSADPEQPLGCDLAALPPTRDAWVALALEPSATVLEAPQDTLPEIPNPGDDRFHGARLDLAEVDLGAYLAKAQARPGLGPRVVLHLRGKGERTSSPVRVKGSTLVLHFEEPADADTPRLAVKLTGTTSPVPLIDVDGGGLEVYGGVLRVSDSASVRVSHVLRVAGGDVKLYRTRIEGPQQNVPVGYRAAVAVAGSGDPDRPRGCAVNECVVLSSKAGVALDGVGCRLLARQSLIVSGDEGLALLPGAACRARVSIQCVLENVTFAARGGVVRLGDAAAAGLVSEPALVQARDCAYLNPFPGRAGKAGMLVYDGDALGRGLLVWQGRREAFDQRLRFAAWPVAAPLPDKAEGYRPWMALWGSGGVTDRRPELIGLRVFDARRWPLERLSLAMKGAGANLQRLGVTRKPPGLP